MATLGPTTVRVSGFPRWIVDCTATPDWSTRDKIVWQCRLNVKHRRLMLAWAVLSGRVRLTRNP